jgi:hypothetical protein
MAQKASPRDAARIENEEKAIALRIGGASYKEIGQRLGLSCSAAHKMVMRVLEKDQRKTAEDRERLLQMELMRLDRMQLGLWSQAKAGNQGAVDRVLRIQERRAKYLGLDAPNRHELTGKDGDPMEIREEPGQLSDEELLEQGAHICHKYREDDATGAGDPVGDPTS